jgi:peptide/nickel transport system ATP-binding protein
MSMTSSDQPILSVRNLSTAFRVDGQWRTVVDTLNFDLAPRETLAVVGESGSGKSVTALSIMRLLPEINSRIQGEIVFEGQNLLALPENEMRTLRGNRVAMIFQEPMTSLNPVLPIGFQISEPLMYHRGMDRQTADREALRLLERVRIPAAARRLNDYPHQLSGGMRQRVMIAISLACRPHVLIADEPTTALDVTIQAEILELIKLLQDEEGMSVIFITHDMGIVAEIADRVLVMLKGHKVEESNTADLFSHPKAAYTRALLSAVPRLGSMKGIKNPEPFAIIDPVTGEPHKPAPHDFSVPETAQPLLRVQNLVTRFDVRSGLFGNVSARVHAVENVSFDLHASETLALVGESGCGKSTTGRSLLRLVEPTSGDIQYDNQSVRDLDAQGLRHMRQSIQMIFQDPFASLNPRKTVGMAIAEPILVHGLASESDAPDIVAALMRRVGLEPSMASRFPHEFSGGQRQRICIARALALKPKLIVADEAVSALDVSIKAQVVNLLMELQAEMGLAFLFISHDMAVVERISHRVAVMYLGEIVEIGPRDRIISEPAHPYTRKLMQAVPIPDPSHRRGRRALTTSELPTPMRSLDFVPPERHWMDLGHGHFVSDLVP